VYESVTRSEVLEITGREATGIAAFGVHVELRQYRREVFLAEGIQPSVPS
jgi:hypothetical protein